MKNNSLRNKGLDEIIILKSEARFRRPVEHKAPYRKHLPVFPTFSSAEAADLSLNYGFIYACRVSKTYSGLMDGFFELRYVKIPWQDQSVARKSYNEWIKNEYNELQMVNRKCNHFENTGTGSYVAHISCKCLKTY